MSDEYFIKTSKQLISNFKKKHPDTSDEIQLIFNVYEKYYKKMYDLERKERILEMETNMALRRENIDLRTEIEGLRSITTIGNNIAVGNDNNNNNNNNNNSNNDDDATMFRVSSLHAKYVNNIDSNNTFKIETKNKNVNQNNNAEKIVAKDSVTLSFDDTSEGRRSCSSSISENSSRPRGTSIFGDLNDFLHDDNIMMGITPRSNNNLSNDDDKYCNANSTVYNNMHNNNNNNNNNDYNDDHEKNPAKRDSIKKRNSRSSIEKILNSRKGSYFSVDNTNDDVINNFSDVYNVKNANINRISSLPSSDRISPALSMNGKSIRKQQLSESELNAASMLGYGPTKVESDLAKRLAKLSGHSDLTPNDLALALARSVNNGIAASNVGRTRNNMNIYDDSNTDDDF